MKKLIGRLGTMLLGAHLVGYASNVSAQPPIRDLYEEFGIIGALIGFGLFILSLWAWTKIHKHMKKDADKINKQLEGTPLGTKVPWWVSLIIITLLLIGSAFLVVSVSSQ
jgi:Ca2+/H+ antiporter